MSWFDRNLFQRGAKKEILGRPEMESSEVEQREMSEATPSLLAWQDTDGQMRIVTVDCDVPLE